MFRYMCVSRHVHGCSMACIHSHGPFPALLLHKLVHCSDPHVASLEFSNQLSQGRTASRATCPPLQHTELGSHTVPWCLWHAQSSLPPLQSLLALAPGPSIADSRMGEGKRGRERNKDGPRPHPVSAPKCSSICAQNVWTHTDWMGQIANDSHMAAHMVRLRTSPGGR